MRIDKKLLIFLVMSVCAVKAGDRMTPRDLKSIGKKDKKRCAKLAFKRSKPEISSDPERILATAEAQSKTPGILDRLFSDEHNKTFEKKTVEELKNRAAQLHDFREKEVETKYLERITAVSLDQDEIRNTKFDLIINLFDRELYERVVQEASSFLLFYPSDERAEFVAYLEILSLDLSRCDFMRDQTATRELLKKASQFLQHESYHLYQPSVRVIMQDAYKSLYESEFIKFDFYARRRELKALEQIYERIKKDIAPFIDLRYPLKQLETILQSIKDGNPYVPHSPWPVPAKKAERPAKKVSYRDRF